MGKPIDDTALEGGDVDTDLHSKGKGGDGAKPVLCRENGRGESVELKVGTEDNEHIVAVKPDGKGSRFALVYVRTRAGRKIDLGGSGRVHGWVALLANLR